jgi:ADP-ribose pyrophosphatase
MFDFKRLKRELTHKGSVINLYTDTILLPDGRKAKWDYVAHDGAAAVLAINEEDKILLVRQYRNSLDRETLEIPAGGLNFKEEPAIKCAARELEEETGYAAGNLEYLLSIKTAVGFSNENIDIYIARDLVKTEQNLDPDEFIGVETFSLDELIEMIYSGKLQDAKTISAILAYAYKR